MASKNDNINKNTLNQISKTPDSRWNGTAAMAAFKAAARNGVGEE